MKNRSIGSLTLWDALLVTTVVLSAFILPVLPFAWHRIAFLVSYTVIYVTAILSLEKVSNYTLLLFATTLVLHWISNLFDLPVLLVISKGVNILFFLLMVVLLIRQIASAREVTAGVILGSIAGYLLMGIVFSIFIAYIIQRDPSAFTANATGPEQTGSVTDLSGSLYFSFVTLASLGYGDILPLKPYTRSLATLIVVSGQFYMAIIVALLVGKFAARKQP